VNFTNSYVSLSAVVVLLLPVHMKIVWPCFLCQCPVVISLMRSKITIQSFILEKLHVGVLAKYVYEYDRGLFYFSGGIGYKLDIHIGHDFGGSLKRLNF